MNDRVTIVFAVFYAFAFFGGLLVGRISQKGMIRYLSDAYVRMRGERDHWRERCERDDRDDADWWKNETA